MDAQYLNFDLVIQRGPDGTYRVHVQSPAGEAESSFVNPFSDEDLNDFFRAASPGRRVRRLDTPEVAAAKKFGERLFNSTFNGETLGLLRASLNDAWHGENKLRIRLRLAGVPELADLPWEYLYNPAVNRFLVMDDDTALVRYLDMPERVRPVQVSLPLRVLVMISNPTQYPQLDVKAEWENLKKSLGDLERQGLVNLELLENATLPALGHQLRKQQCHIFHYIGHGGFDERTQEGVLVLQDEYGKARFVSGQELGWVLHNHRSLSLAVLNACEGARADLGDAFSGTAQSLVQQGIPAVVAMQFEITDAAAKTFAQAFYASVATGQPVEAAMTQTRLVLFAEGHGLQWGTPVLYMRSPEGRIFDVRKSSGESQPRPVEALYEEVRPAMPAGNWPTASEKAQAVPVLEPGHEEAATDLQQAQKQQALNHLLNHLYTTGRAHFDAGRWDEAIAAFAQVQALQSDYKDTATLIGEAQGRRSTAASQAQHYHAPSTTAATTVATTAATTAASPPTGSASGPPGVPRIPLLVATVPLLVLLIAGAMALLQSLSAVGLPQGATLDQVSALTPGATTIAQSNAAVTPTPVVARIDTDATAQEQYVSLTASARSSQTSEANASETAVVKAQARATSNAIAAADATSEARQREDDATATAEAEAQETSEAIAAARPIATESVGEQSALIDSVTVDHNVNDYDEGGNLVKGMQIHVYFSEINNLQGVECRAAAFFWYSALDIKMIDLDGKYNTTDGYVAVGKSFVPTDTEYVGYGDEIELFMPYSQLHLQLQIETRLKFYVRLYVVETNETLDESDWVSFCMNCP